MVVGCHGLSFTFCETSGTFLKDNYPHRYMSVTIVNGAHEKISENAVVSAERDAVT